MDNKPPEYLRMHRSFGFYQRQVSPQSSCDVASSRMYRRFFKWTIFPTVHACEPTSSPPQALELRKPKLFITDQEIQDRISNEIAIDRVKAIFQKDYLDNYHPELLNVMAVTKGTCLGTFILMSILGSIHGRQEFIKQHEHVKFKTNFRAIRAYQDAIFVSGMKTGGLYAFKVGLFTFTFFLSSTGMSTYLNRTSFLDYTFGGSVAGTLFRFNLGPKGMFAGGIIGATIGTVAGLALSGMQHAAGDTIDIRHNNQIHDQLLHEKESALISSGEITREDVTNLHIVHS